MIVDLDADVARALSTYQGSGFSSLGRDTYRSSLRLKPGDIISMTIYELTPIPIFGTGSPPPAPAMAPGSGHVATIPQEVIEQDGSVPVPFGGSVKIAGLTPAEAGHLIASLLEKKATAPQVVVTLEHSAMSTAFVNGDVEHPGAVELTLRNERILDAIAEAGGSKYPLYDTDVQLIRAGKVARSNMQHLVTDPKQNIHARPGDSIVLIHNPKSFTVLGAALKVSQYDFNLESVTLAEALARSGGLNDALADRGDVYLLHLERASLVKELLSTKSSPTLKSLDDSALVPVAYHLNLSSAAGYFISQSTKMRDKDVILVSNAQSVEFSKLLVILKNISGIYYDFAIPAKNAGASVLGGSE